jgi:hypothetical protein
MIFQAGQYTTNKNQFVNQIIILFMRGYLSPRLLISPLPLPLDETVGLP